MFNEVCTVYNKYVDKGVEKWQRVVIAGVYWGSVRGANYRKTGLENADAVSVIIPSNFTADREYIKPKSWHPLADKNFYFTLQPGDTIIKGLIDYEVVRSSKELEQFDDCFKITKVDHKDFGSGMDHWEVGAK